MSLPACPIVILNEANDIPQWNQNLKYLATSLSCAEYITRKPSRDGRGPTFAEDVQAPEGTIQELEEWTKRIVVQHVLLDSISGRVLAYMRSILGYCPKKIPLAMAKELAEIAATRIDDDKFPPTELDLAKIKVELEYGAESDYLWCTKNSWCTKRQYEKGVAWMQDITARGAGEKSGEESGEESGKEAGDDPQPESVQVHQPDASARPLSESTGRKKRTREAIGNDADDPAASTSQPKRKRSGG